MKKIIINFALTISMLAAFIIVVSSVFFLNGVINNSDMGFILSTILKIALAIFATEILLVYIFIIYVYKELSYKFDLDTTNSENIGCDNVFDDNEELIKKYYDER